MMEDLSLHILDLAENSAAAGATRVRVAVNENEGRDTLTIRVAGDGRGMTAAERARALDAFYTTGPKRTGLGLPLLAQTAEACGGRLSLASSPGRGTTVVVRLPFSHLDRPPLTRMAPTMMALFFGHPDLDVLYTHTRNGRRFSLLRAAGGNSTAVEIGTLREALRRGLARIGAA
jgi:anti-sigma regulatory factor (Ser/Thr protein kinase)